MLRRDTFACRQQVLRCRLTLVTGPLVHPTFLRESWDSYTTMRLIASPMGEPLYRSLGFETFGPRVVVYQRPCEPYQTHGSEAGIDRRGANVADDVVDQALALDAHVVASSPARTRMLRDIALRAGGRCAVAEHGGSAACWLRPTSDGAFVGPLVASGIESARSALRQALSVLRKPQPRDQQDDDTSKTDTNPVALALVLAHEEGGLGQMVFEEEGFSVAFSVPLLVYRARKRAAGREHAPELHLSERYVALAGWERG